VCVARVSERNEGVTDWVCACEQFKVLDVETMTLPCVAIHISYSYAHTHTHIHTHLKI
jgi:hypothetical protein